MFFRLKFLQVQYFHAELRISHTCLDVFKCFLLGDTYVCVSHSFVCVRMYVYIYIYVYNIDIYRMH